MRLVIAETLILFSDGSSSTERCKCSPASGETTRSGANEHIVVSEKRKNTRIAGVVRDANGQLISDVLAFRRLATRNGDNQRSLVPTAILAKADLAYARMTLAATGPFDSAMHNSDVRPQHPALNEQSGDR
jgi:hypothetical protein